MSEQIKTADKFSKARQDLEAVEAGLKLLYPEQDLTQTKKEVMTMQPPPMTPWPNDGTSSISGASVAVQPSPEIPVESTGATYRKIAPDLKTEIRKEAVVEGGATPSTETEVKSASDFIRGIVKMINELTPEIKEKAFDPGWFKLYEQLRLIEDREAAIRKEELEKAYRECASIVLNNFCPSNDRGYAAQQTAQAILTALSGAKEGGRG